MRPFTYFLRYANSIFVGGTVRDTVNKKKKRRSKNKGEVINVNFNPIAKWFKLDRMFNLKADVIIYDLTLYLELYPSFALFNLI